jgi:ABC-2 type transport system ATP-binding protein
VALLGRAGAGKTTAIGLALGLYTPSSGTVRLFGAMPGRMKARRRTGVMMQRANLPGAALVHDLIRLVRAYYPSPLSVEQASATAGIQHLLGWRVGRLSAAQRRDVQFALAICGRPDVLILDDPCAGMDSAGRERLWCGIRTLVRDGCAVLTTSHYADELEGLADRVCVLSGGTLVAEFTLAELCAQDVVRRVVCRTTATMQMLYDLPEVLLIHNQPDGRLSIETGMAELLVQRLYCLDPCVSDVQVLHAKTPHVVRIS